MPIEVKYGMDPAAVALLSLLGGMGRPQAPPIPQFDTSLPSPGGGGGGGGGGRSYHAPIPTLKAPLRSASRIAELEAATRLQQESEIRRAREALPLELEAKVRAAANEVDYVYTAKQKQGQARAANAHIEIDKSPYLNPAEKARAHRDVDFQHAADYEKAAMPKDTPRFQPGQDIGDVWELPDGSTVTRNMNGNIEPVQTYRGSPAEQANKAKIDQEKFNREAELQERLKLLDLRHKIMSEQVVTYDEAGIESGKRPITSAEAEKRLEFINRGASEQTRIATPEQLLRTRETELEERRKIAQMRREAGVPQIGPVPPPPTPEEQRAAAETKVVRIKNDAEYDALPSGTFFIDPNGKPRRKP